MKMQRSRGCAWFGLYLSTSRAGLLLARVVLSARIYDRHQFGVQCFGVGSLRTRWRAGPALGLALPIGWYRSCTGMRCPRLVELDIPLPYVPWRYPAGPVYRALYRVSCSLWHRVQKASAL